jgi:hypothetical protein
VDLRFNIFIFEKNQKHETGKPACQCASYSSRAGANSGHTRLLRVMANAFGGQARA